MRVMRGRGIQFLAGCLVGFVLMALGWGWALLGVAVVVVLFAKLRSAGRSSSAAACPVGWSPAAEIRASKRLMSGSALATTVGDVSAGIEPADGVLVGAEPPSGFDLSPEPEGHHGRPLQQIGADAPTAPSSRSRATAVAPATVRTMVRRSHLPLPFDRFGAAAGGRISPGRRSGSGR